ncbi:MAG TPA: hypothetical protein VHK69_00630, partial [Chitinophagaceae bacterium]|nr:hypothetical protein [Chitinophagaceae bacterium]
YFINSPEALTGIFHLELNGLQHVAARSVQLELTLSPGLQADRVYGSQPERKGNTLTFRFQDLISEDRKGILVRFLLKQPVTGPIPISVTLTWKEPQSESVSRLQQVHTLEPAADTGTYLRSFNEEVIRQALGVLSNEELEASFSEADRGHFADARRRLRRNHAYLGAHPGYLERSVALQQMDSLTTAYAKALQGAEQWNADTLRLVQKTHRLASYRLRNKKGK